MAAVPIQIDGVFYPYVKDANSQPVAGSMVGHAYIVGLGVGGGPIIPTQPPGSSSPPHPEHPIWGPPGFNPPGSGMPPGIGGGPIIPPEMPEVPPGTPPNSVVKEAPVGGWGYYTDSSSTPYAAFRTEKQPK